MWGAPNFISNKSHAFIWSNGTFYMVHRWTIWWLPHLRCHHKVNTQEINQFNFGKLISNEIHVIHLFALVLKWKSTSKLVYFEHWNVGWDPFLFVVLTLYNLVATSFCVTIIFWFTLSTHICPTFILWPSNGCHG
jgi:hypothetical protein